MTLERTLLSAAGADTIREIATAEYPHEACGVLLGEATGSEVRVLGATAGRNLNTERARDRYLLDPGDIVRADREARRRGIDVVGFWHSHPDHPAWPSQFDADHAYTDYVYVIVHSNAEGTGDLNAFTLEGESAPFRQLSLDVAPEAEPG